MNNIDPTISASVCAGATATALGHPLDLVRTRLLFGSAVGQASNFGRGLGFSLGVSVFKNGAIWPIQKKLKEEVSALDLTDVQASVVSGAVGTFIPNIISAPFNITKVHLMRDETRKSAFHAASKIHKKEGVRGFLRGTPATVARDLKWGAIYFPVKEDLEKRISAFKPNQAEVTTTFQASLASGAIATSSASWVDAVRNHQMNHDRKPASVITAIKRAVSPTMANFKATVTGVSRVTLTTAVSHTAFEYLHSKFSGE